MRHWPRNISKWDRSSTAPSRARSGPDPINPLRIARLVKRGLSYREIGILIAKQDGRKMSYTSQGVYFALRAYYRDERDEDGERLDWKPASNKQPRPINLGSGIGLVLFGNSKREAR